ncbi:MAG: 2-hydroxyacid dehydrogenase [Chitinispirillia bacterium]|nr:2-hydroxyacid dehydrogenase [Chitinispirillia bacterium]
MKIVKIAFFDTKPYDQEFFEKINKDYGFQIGFFPARLTLETAPLAAGYETVCVFVNDMVTAQIIDKLYETGVRHIALRSAGYNNVDLGGAYGKIHVTRVPAYSPYAVAEHAVALMLTLNRKTHRAFIRTRENNFSINGLMGFDMYNKTVGIVGTGRIGQITAEILKGFGMKILVYDIYPNKEFAQKFGVEYVTIDELFSKSDIISLHCPLTPQNIYMIDSSSIAKMRDGVMIINTGRGKLINTKDLINGLKSRKIGSAGLDVYEEEGDYFFEDFSAEAISDDVLARLTTFPNVLITSHQAFFTKEALTNIAQTTLENISLMQEDKYPNEICYRCSEDNCPRERSGKCF